MAGLSRWRALFRVPSMHSLADWLALQPASVQQELLSSLGQESLVQLTESWGFWARPSQMTPPGDWFVWLLKAGRGFGKTRTGAQFVRQKIESGAYGRGALVAATAADARDVMVEGESGLLAVSSSRFRPAYQPSRRRVEWPNGAIVTLYSAEEPDQLRGPQHDFGWADEIAKWRRPDTWNQLTLGMRLGPNPQICVTTTPKPTALLKSIIADSSTTMTEGSTYDNLSNLSPKFIQQVVNRYEGTRLGLQELYARVLDDNPRALWKRERLDRHRVTEVPPLRRIVVAVDPGPNATGNEGGTPAETGIVVAGIDFQEEPHGYLLEDCSMTGTPKEWGLAVVAAFNRWQADVITVEANNGGDMIAHVIHSVKGGAGLPVKKVWASRGKITRAEPVAALDEQGRLHHVGFFPVLEDQLCEWEPGDVSPDHLDAYVWGVTELFLSSLEERPGQGIWL